MTTDELLNSLCGLDESPLERHYGKPLSSKGLADRLRPYAIHPDKYREGKDTHRGYTKAVFEDAWYRYLQHPQESATPATSGTSQVGVTRDVPDVAGVPAFPGWGRSVSDTSINNDAMNSEVTPFAWSEEIERVTL